MTIVKEVNPIARSESAPQKENEPRNPHVGLQVRLLLSGEALNPNKALTAITPDTIKPFDQRDYAPYSAASTRERTELYKDDTTSFEEQKKAWISDTKHSFKGLSEQLKKPEAQQLKTFFNIIGGLNLDVEHISDESINRLYDRYFSGEHTESQIQQFVGDVLKAHITQNGQLDIEKLSQNFEGIQWLSQIFGEDSPLMIDHLIEAELMALSPQGKTALIQEALTEQNGKLRINHLTDDEKYVLDFISNHQPSTQTDRHDTHDADYKGDYKKPVLKPGWRTGNPEDDGKEKWRYYRQPDNGEPRKFPGDANDYSSRGLAERMKRSEPERYGTFSVDELTNIIDSEAQKLTDFFDSRGFTENKLSELAQETLEGYQQFLTSQYGITAPHIESIELKMLGGKAGNFFNAHKGTYAFVDYRHPVIFLNMETIARHAAQLGGGRNVRGLTKEDMERLLPDVMVHEYNHIIGDAALWVRGTRDAQGDIHTNDPTENLPAKRALMTGKPQVDKDGRLVSYKETGRGLNEALTQELTSEWAKSIHATLDLNAYSQERTVLHSLIQHLASTKGISSQDALKQFVKGYFSPREFRHLVKELSGPRDASGKYSRPHLFTLTEALMEWEASNNSHDYDITNAFIKGTLNTLQRRQIEAALPTLDISLRMKNYMREKVLNQAPLQNAA